MKKGIIALAFVGILTVAGGAVAVSGSASAMPAAPQVHGTLLPVEQARWRGMWHRHHNRGLHRGWMIGRHRGWVHARRRHWR